MKTAKLILIAAITVASTTFAQAQTMKKTINSEKSAIDWTGKKVLGTHMGTINFSNGYLEMDGDKLVGGMFTVDMSTITVTDLKPGDGKEKLEGHLSSDDFFGVATHPTATLVIKSATKTPDGHVAKGDLTIKGHTEPVTFDMDMGADFASTSLKVDRTKYGVRYGSGSFFDNLGDNTISDDFELNITLKF